MKTRRIEVSKGRYKLEGLVQEIGADVLVSIWGGTLPHIGAVAMAMPRPSLKDSRKWSATSSNFTFLGHKEDRLVKRISEKLSAALRKNVVVAAGIHWDSLSSAGIKTIENLTERLSELILKSFEK